VRNVVNHASTDWVGRRAFLANGSLVLAAGLDLMSRAGLLAEEAPKKGGVRIGLVTDLHYADKKAAGTRHYRETLDKLSEAAERFKKDAPAFVVELGDLIDAADSVETEMKYLKRIDKEFSALAKDRHYVLGNHCVDTLTKKEFLDAVGQKEAHYSFDRGGVHFVVLDACFRGDGKPYERKNFKWTDANIPADQLDWLKSDLKATDKPVVVFAHQQLDVGNDYGVKNAADVRKVLEGSKKVLAVFQGHSHKNDYKEIGNVHYCTLVAMIEGSGIENNGYSILDVAPDGAITVTGFRKQKSYEWKGTS
jgi:3',5'-cyclic AMP phosphodiesterase CpdA